jgi:hypothetical protein
MQKLKRLDASHCPLVTFAVRGLRFWLWGFVLGFAERVTKNTQKLERVDTSHCPLVTFAVRGLRFWLWGSFWGLRRGVGKCAEAGKAGQDSCHLVHVITIGKSSL